MTGKEFVSFIVSSLTGNHDFTIQESIDERGVLLKLNIGEENAGRVIGSNGSNAQSLRVLLRTLGRQEQAHYNLVIEVK